MRFDAITPTVHAATVQAHAIAKEASDCLAREGWSIMEAEREVKGQDVTGHLDILAWHGESQRTAIIDLKTGRDIGAGWLQVGGYLSLHAAEVQPQAVFYVGQVDGGILHVPSSDDEQGFEGDAGDTGRA